MKAYLFIFLFCTSSAFAQVYHGPISSSMGGTGRAGIGGGEGAFLNPAVIPLIKNYDFTATFRDGEVGAGQHRQGWGIGAVDNSEDVLFPGAAHFVRTRETGRASAPSNGEIWHAAGAYLLNDQFSIGVSVYRLHHKVKPYPAYVQWNGSLGMVYLLNENFSVAYVLDNLAKPGSEIPLGLREDMRHSLGTFARFAEMAILRFDLSRLEKNNPDHKMIYMFGLESATSEFMVFRAGYNLDDIHNRRVWSAGFAFNGPRLRVDYSFEKAVEDSSGALHSVDLKVPF